MVSNPGKCCQRILWKGDDAWPMLTGKDGA